MLLHRSSELATTGERLLLADRPGEGLVARERDRPAAGRPRVVRAAAHELADALDGHDRLRPEPFELLPSGGVEVRHPTLTGDPKAT